MFPLIRILTKFKIFFPNEDVKSIICYTVTRVLYVILLQEYYMLYCYKSIICYTLTRVLYVILLQEYYMLYCYKSIICYTVTSIR